LIFSPSLLQFSFSLLSFHHFGGRNLDVQIELLRQINIGIAQLNHAFIQMQTSFLTQNYHDFPTSDSNRYAKICGHRHQHLKISGNDFPLNANQKGFLKGLLDGYDTHKAQVQGQDEKKIYLYFSNDFNKGFTRTFHMRYIPGYKHHWLSSACADNLFTRIKSNDSYHSVEIVGEDKAFDVNLGNSEKGQTLGYLIEYVRKQNRPWIYGYLTNLKHIIFFKVENQGRLEDNEFLTYESSEMSFCDGLPLLLGLLAASPQKLGFNPPIPESYINERILGRGLTSMVFQVKKGSILCAFKSLIDEEFKESIDNECTVLRALNALNIKGVPECMGLVNEGEKGQPVYGIFISPILQDVGYFGRSKAEQLFDLVVQIHKQGYLHRDIRPDNVKLNQLTNQVYLIDFGFAIKKGTPKTYAGALRTKSNALLKTRDKIFEETDDYSSAVKTIYLLTSPMQWQEVKKISAEDQLLKFWNERPPIWMEAIRQAEARNFTQARTLVLQCI